jgi:hypothetical protein
MLNGYVLKGLPVILDGEAMRLKSHIWVSAYLRRLDAAFISAVVVRRGDADAGAIYIKLTVRAGLVLVLTPVPAGMAGHGTDTQNNVIEEEGRAWQAIALVTEEEADGFLKRQATRDPDMWILEVESQTGRHFIGETILAPAFYA